GGEEGTALLTNCSALTPPRPSRPDSHRCALSLLGPLTEQPRQPTACLSNSTAPTPRRSLRSCLVKVLVHRALLLADSAAARRGDLLHRLIRSQRTEFREGR